MNRNCCELDVAASAPETAGQRVEARDCAIGLGRVRVLPDSGPGVVGDRAGVGEHLGRSSDVSGRDAGNRLERVATELRALLAKGIEHRPAADRAFEGRHRHLAFERPRRAVERSARRGLRTSGDRVPDHEPVRRAAGDEIVLPQQSRLRAVDEETRRWSDRA